MPGKTVVFCEGIREATLISIILDQREIKNRIIPHENLENPKENTPENNRINEFLSRKGKSHKFLLKDEGGDTKCVDSFLNLYGDKDDRYLGIVFIDSTAEGYFKSQIQAILRRDILKRESDNLYLTKDSMNRNIIHRVFFTPDDLERQVKSITGKNLDLQDRDGMKAVLIQFVSVCRERNVDWFNELESVVLSEA
ncbi:MAG: hypothetical protein Q7J03_03930 [Methanoregula sp.]|nr:hypothetical protein [Methanoregula sp.]